MLKNYGRARSVKNQRDLDMEIAATIKMNHFPDHGGRRGGVGITRRRQITCRFGESRSFSLFALDFGTLVVGYF